MEGLKQNNEFKALQLKWDETSTIAHTIYFKEHSIRKHSSDKPSGRTLFVINLPPYVDEQGLKNAFSEAGVIVSVQILKKPTLDEPQKIVKFIPPQSLPTFKVAYLVFKKVSELNHALNLHSLKPINLEKCTIKSGLMKWIKEHNSNIIPAEYLKEQVEAFMKQFDSEKEITDKKEKQLEQEDDDGWITVTKKSKVQSFARTEKVENKILAKEEKNKDRKELKNFYTFQIRESKMKHIVSLRQKFEEDKKKIMQLKQSRRFKPF